MKNNTASTWMVCMLCVAAGLGIYYFAFDRPAQQNLLAELETKQQALAAKQAEIEARQKPLWKKPLPTPGRPLKTPTASTWKSSNKKP